MRSILILRKAEFLDINLMSFQIGPYKYHETEYAGERMRNCILVLLKMAWQ